MAHGGKYCTAAAWVNCGVSLPSNGTRAGDRQQTAGSGDRERRQAVGDIAAWRQGAAEKKVPV